MRTRSMRRSKTPEKKADAGRGGSRGKGQRKARKADVDVGPGYPLFTFDWGGRGGRDGRHSSRGGRERERERDRDRDRDRDRYYRDRR